MCEHKKHPPPAASWPQAPPEPCPGLSTVPPGSGPVATRNAGVGPCCSWKLVIQLDIAFKTDPPKLKGKKNSSKLDLSCKPKQLLPALELCSDTGAAVTSLRHLAPFLLHLVLTIDSVLVTGGARVPPGHGIPICPPGSSPSSNRCCCSPALSIPLRKGWGLDGGNAS